MGNIITVGPNKALIVSGGCGPAAAKKTVVGGWAWAWWLVTDVQKLSLEVMTLHPKCEDVETVHGVAVTVTGVAQCKIMNNPDMLQVASEQFLGRDEEEIADALLQTIEGHLRAILGTLTVEEAVKNREQFAKQVREIAEPGLLRMGVEILSFTIKDIYDKEEYLSSLGKTETAAVKRDADIGVAQANRDAGIKEAECEKSAMDVKYATDTKIEANTREFNLQKAQYDQEVNTLKAEAELAYKLQAAKVRQKIRNEEIQIEVVERRKQIQVEEQEIKRKEKELIATVKLPAEAESYQVEVKAQGKRTQTVEHAKAEAHKIKTIGSSEAEAIEMLGKAEAEKMRMKASAYKHYGDAAVLSMVLEALPKIAAQVSAPLAKTEEIVMLGETDRTTAEINKLVGQLPPGVRALTGIDVSKALSEVTKLI